MKIEALDTAFRASSYRVETDDGIFELRIGVHDPAFDDFLLRQGVSCWGLLTAYNPGGIRCDDENPLRQMQLLERLQRLGWTYRLACNVADDGGWPAEPGFLLLQVSEKDVSSMAAEFSQRACVCGDIGSAPRLVWI